MEVSCQLHAPAALPHWKQATINYIYEAGWGLRTDPDDREEITFLTLNNGVF
jgi:hypothetical protein